MSRDLKAQERWSELKAAVRRGGAFMPSVRRYPDAGRALALAAHADAERARDDLLEEAYQAEAAGNGRRALYLMRLAGEVVPATLGRRREGGSAA